MKRITVGMVTLIMVMVITGSVQADDETNSYRGEFLGLAGNTALGQASYLLADNLKLNGDLENNVLRSDLHYQLTDWYGVKIGIRHDFDQSEAILYGGFDFFTPFGTNNLKLAGYYDYNYQGKDWSRYEAALRIEMYKDQFVYAGVRGDGGKGFQPYDYNAKNDPLFFLRGDFGWQWGKRGQWGLNLRPLIYATGYIMEDTSLKYSINDRMNLVLNITDYYDRQLKYRLGLDYKF